MTDIIHPDIQKIGVVGAGIMGCGIAQTFLEKNIPVVLVDINKNLVMAARNQIFDSIAKRFDKKYISHMPDINLLLTTEDKEKLRACDLIIEGVSENVQLKCSVLKDIENYISDTAILASNTSSISIDLLQSQLLHRNRFMGIHFMNPPVRIPLVELIKGTDTTELCYKTVNAFLISHDKTPILVKDTPGFVVNTLLIPMINSAIQMLEDDTASAADIDTAMTNGANFPIGPLALGDMIGLDTVLAIMNLLEQSAPQRYKPAELLRSMVKSGHLGRKSGEGFFPYAKNS